ncbi:MAG: hypothetical protein IJU76_10180 [Desulfovibrionaceae bacterium]|nr:hypothetical protein [Desulfovibrionaceae bacterium]
MSDEQNAQSENKQETNVVIQTLDFESKDGQNKENVTQEQENLEESSENAQSFEEASDRLWNQNLRLISAILVAIFSAAFLWWFVS